MTFCGITIEKVRKSNYFKMPEKFWNRNILRQIFAELISTFFLLFFGCMSCVPTIGQPLYASFGFGFTVLICIVIFGQFSGAHMNPAVSIAFLIWGKMSSWMCLSFIITQLVGSVVGYGVLLVISPVDLALNGVCVSQIHPGINEVQALLVETLLTAAMVGVCCALWNPINEAKNETNAIKFGLVIAGLAIAGGPLTGASMNPARSFAPALWTGMWKSHWVYWAGPILGAMLSSLCYKFVFLEIKENCTVETIK